MVTPSWFSSRGHLLQRLGLPLGVLVWSWLVGGPALAGEPLAASPVTTMGTAQGAFTVTDRGNSSYSIEIPTPPGLNNLQPKLSLAYNNAADNGMVGVGWSLIGLTSIDRTGANITQDGFRGGVTYGTDDRFTYHGQRLIAVDARSDGTGFRTEIESWTRIVSHDRTDAGATCGSGPCWWTATSDKGLIFELGRTPDSRALAKGGDGSVRSWSINKVTDLNGNVLTVTYTAIPYAGAVDTGQIYPSRIDYTSNPAAGLTPQRVVTFAYEGRPDVIGVYIGGYPVDTAARLKRIDSAVDGTPAPAIVLSYAQSTSTGRSQVTQIAECAGDDSQCLTPTIFGWSGAKLAFNAPAGWLSGDFTQGWTAQDPRLLADVNGDGLADVVGIRLDTQVATAKSDGGFAPASTWNTGFGRSTGWTDARTPRTAGDVNGDGLADIVGFNYLGVEVALSTGESFDKAGWSQTRYPYFGFDPSAGGWVRERNPRMLADVNGDGLADVVGFGDQTMVGLSNGAGFEAPTAWNASDFTGDPWWRQTERLRLIGDVNGDGRADIVAFSSTGVIVGVSTGGQTNQFDLGRWPQNVGGYADFTLAQGWRSSIHPRLLADVNGDGLADIVGFKDGVQVALSTGKGFLAPQRWNTGFSAESSPPWRAGETRLMIDVDGDHRADVVGFSVTGAKVALNRGAQFTDGLWDAGALAGFVPSSDHPVQTSDVNGDGLGDAVAFGANRGQATTLAVGLAGGAQPDLVTQITNGLGGHLDLTYAPLSDREVYTPGATANDPSRAAAGLTSFVQAQPYDYNANAAAYPIRDIVGGPIYVIKKVVESSDPARQASRYRYATRYSYADAKLDQLSQRWLGFASKTRVYEEDGRKTVEVYNQPFPLTGTLQRREIRCGAVSSDPLCVPDALVTLSPMDYSAVQTATGLGTAATPVWDLRKTRQTVAQYVNGQFDTATQNTYAYDDYGQPVLQSYIGRVDASGRDLSPEDDVYACKRYVNDPVGWRLGYLDVLKFSASADCGGVDQFRPGVDLSLTIQAYDQKTFELTSKQLWDDQAGRFHTASYAYDAFGNQVSVVDPVGQVWRTTFDPKFHTFVQTVQGPPLAPGRTVSTSYNFDPRFGLQTAEVDPNGNVIVTCLDSLGREIARQVTPPDKSTPSDKSCIDAGPGSGVRVVTNRTTDWVIGAGGETYSQTRTLQAWPDGQTPATWLYGRQSLDGRARIYRSVQQGDPASGDIIDCTVYDGYDRTPLRSLPFFSKTGADCDATAADRLWRTQRYDILGRIVERARPGGADGGQTIRDLTAYPSYLRAIQTLAAGTPQAYVRQFQYDMRLNDKSIMSVSVTSDGGALTQIERDRMGEISATVSPPTAASAGIRTTYVRDSLGRVIRTNSPDRGAVLNDYQGTPYLKQQTTTNGVETFDYDAHGRMTRHDLGRGFTYNFTYDSPAVTNGVGRQTGLSASDPRLSAPITQLVGYDSQGNPSSVTTSGLPGVAASQVLTTAYDPQGRPRLLALPNGAKLERNYQYGLLAYLKLDALTVARFNGYTPDGKPTAVAYDGAVTETLAYTPVGLLRGQQVVQGVQTYLNRAYDWSPLDELLTVEDVAGYGGHDLGESYAYASLRLSSANGVFGRLGYAYDKAGNLTHKTEGSGVETEYSYTGFQLRKAARGGVAVYSADYDAYGAMTRRIAGHDDQTFAYDPEARLISALGADGAERARFYYDGQGARAIMFDAASGITTATISPSYEVRAKAGGLLTTVVLHDDLGPVAMVSTGDAALAGPGAPPLGVLHFHRNQVGSTILTTRGDGSVGSLMAYEPYGAPIRIIGPNDFDTKFAGLTFDEPTGLYYSATRYMDPQTGRFTTADNGPSAEPQIQDSLNTYAYVAGRPTSLVDPTGQFLPLIAAALPEIGAVAAEGAAVAAEGAAVSVEAGAAIGEIAAAGATGLSESVATETAAASTMASFEIEVTETTALASRAAMTSEATAATGSAVSGEAAAQASLLEAGSLADVTAFEGEGSLLQCPSPCRLLTHLRYQLSPYSNRPVTLLRGLSHPGEIAELESSSTLRSPYFRANGVSPPSNQFGMFARFLHSIDSSGSPYVSTTSSASVARTFAGSGRIYQFQVPRSAVSRAWWSFFPHEFEYLARDGQVVSNVTRLQ